MDDLRRRFLQDRVLTASPAQRVVMLYDRLLLDLARARAATVTDRTDADVLRAADRPAAGPHLAHAAAIVAELHDSLDRDAGGPADNLADLYTYMLRELLTAQVGNECAAASLATIEQIAQRLRDTWSSVASVDSVESGGLAAPTAPAVSVRPQAEGPATGSDAGSSWTA